MIGKFCMSLGIVLIFSGALLDRAFGTCSDVGCAATVGNCSMTTAGCGGIGENGGDCKCLGEPNKCYCTG